MGVIINNQNTKILGFALKGRPSIPSANKKYETIEIEGRDGSLTRFINYEDLKFSLTFNILFQDDIKQKLREIKGLMANAKTLSFDDSPNFFYKIKQAQVSDTESIIKRHGVFSVDFVADSFEYEASSVFESVSPNLNLFQNSNAQSNSQWNAVGSTRVTLTTSDNVFVSSLDVPIDSTQIGFWQDGIISVKGATYTLSALIKNVSSYVFSEFRVVFVTRGNATKTYYKAFQIPNDGNYHFVTFSYTVTDDDVKTIGGQFYINKPIQNAKAIFWTKRPKLEQGSTATPWMPSATEEYINTAKLLIRNNTTYFSQPIIKIFGQGNIKLYVNNELIEFKNVMDGIVLDSEKQEAYLSDVNKNSQMIGNFPTFGIGENQIICTGKVNKVEILPQWRWLT